jgi:hypothetical protein
MMEPDFRGEIAMTRAWADVQIMMVRCRNRESSSSVHRGHSFGMHVVARAIDDLEVSSSSWLPVTRFVARPITGRRTRDRQ